MKRGLWNGQMGVGVVGGNNRTPYLLGWRSKGVVEAYNRVGDGLKFEQNWLAKPLFFLSSFV